MLYIDILITKQHLVLDECARHAEVLKDRNTNCVPKSFEVFNNNYGKYFGLYRLLNYTNVIVGEWTME